MALSKKTKSILNQKLEELNSCRPVSRTVLSKIREHFQIEMTYNSNAIEGNTLTLKETAWVIQEGITIKGKPLKDHLEAKNQKGALDFLYELVDSKKQNTISERLIREIHYLIVKESDADIAGKYREGNVVITGADHTPPEGFNIPSEMQNLIKWINTNKSKLHPIELAAIVHHKLAYIHPFWDGNGRVSRIVMNVFIMQAGFPMAIILKNDRKRYYRVLSEADQGDYSPFCEFVAQSVIRSLNLYLKFLKPRRKKSDEDLTLEELAEEGPYSATYLRKLATQGKLEAFKEKRNWLSSKRALKEYMDSVGKKF
jgi:Fic family protein